MCCGVFCSLLDMRTEEADILWEVVVGADSKEEDKVRDESITGSR
jgi:hypothetical protein